MIDAAFIIFGFYLGLVLLFKFMAWSNPLGVEMAYFVILLKLLHLIITFTMCVHVCLCGQGTTFNSLLQP